MADSGVVVATTERALLIVVLAPVTSLAPVVAATTAVVAVEAVKLELNVSLVPVSGGAEEGVLESEIDCSMCEAL